MSETMCIYCEKRPVEIPDSSSCAECEAEAYKPISRAECERVDAERGDLYFARYRKLGGRLSRARYREALIAFLFETNDVYISGYCVRHNSRDEAIGAVAKWLRENAPRESVRRIFRSVDEVDAYT